MRIGTLEIYPNKCIGKKKNPFFNVSSLAFVCVHTILCAQSVYRHCFKGGKKNTAKDDWRKKPNLEPWLFSAQAKGNENSMHIRLCVDRRDGEKKKKEINRAKTASKELSHTGYVSEAVSKTSQCFWVKSLQKKKDKKKS